MTESPNGRFESDALDTLVPATPASRLTEPTKVVILDGFLFTTIFQCFRNSAIRLTMYSRLE
jgi:hypothetical protein